MIRLAFKKLPQLVCTQVPKYSFSEEPLLQYKNPSENLTNKIFSHTYEDETNLTPKKIV